MGGKGLQVIAFAALLLLVGCLRNSPPNPIEGLIVSVDEGGLSLASDGETYEFEIADRSVTIEHLRVHQRDRLPVRIEWREGADARRAISIVDVPSVP